MANREMSEQAIRRSYLSMRKPDEEWLVKWIRERGMTPDDPQYRLRVRSFVELSEKAGVVPVIEVDGQHFQFV